MKKNSEYTISYVALSQCILL